MDPRQTFRDWFFSSENSGFWALFALLVSMALVGTCNGQTDAKNWRKLGGEVCMPLEELHLIHAKRLVSDDLNRTRARILVRQEEVIQNLRRQLELQEEDIHDLKELTADAFQKRDFAIGLNQDLQKKLARQTSWATAMKIVTVLAGGTLVVVGVNTISP